MFLIVLTFVYLSIHPYLHLKDLFCFFFPQTVGLLIPQHRHLDYHSIARSLTHTNTYTQKCTHTCSHTLPYSTTGTGHSVVWRKTAGDPLLNQFLHELSDPERKGRILVCVCLCVCDQHPGSKTSSRITESDHRDGGRLLHTTGTWPGPQYVKESCDCVLWKTSKQNKRKTSTQMDRCT